MPGTTPNVDTIIQGDCLEEMKKLPDRSIDAIVTDPPYELAFMGKKWDASGIAYNVDMWGECLRVLKPGGHLLAFGGARTYHRMACAIEDAGFEIRDSLHWVYGSGFPKSLSIDKALDKRYKENDEAITAKQELGKWLKESRGERPQKEIAKHFPSKTGGLTGCVANWELGFNLPTWDIWIKLKEILSLDDRFDYLIEGRPSNFIEAEREVIRAGTPKGRSRGIYGDFTEDEYNYTAPSTDLAKQWAGWGSALKPAHEPIVLARKPLEEPTIAGNVLRWGTGGLNIDACRIKTLDTDPSKKNWHQNREVKKEYDVKNSLYDIGIKTVSTIESPMGRFPSNLIHDASPVVLAEFAKAGERKPGARPSKRNHSMFDSQPPMECGERIEFDSGSASRFFQACEFTPADYAPIVYYAKAAPSERNGSTHPTMKPLSLMRYLCKLITPPGGLILDPFGGSGTTCLAALQEGFHYIGIEKEPEYCEIARKRVAAVPARLDRWAEAEG